MFVMMLLSVELVVQHSTKQFLHGPERHVLIRLNKSEPILYPLIIPKKFLMIQTWQIFFRNQ